MYRIAVVFLLVLLPAFALAGDALDLLGQVESTCATVTGLTDDVAGAAGLLALEGTVKVLESQLPYSDKELKALQQSVDEAAIRAMKYDERIRNLEDRIPEIDENYEETRRQISEAKQDRKRWDDIMWERKKKLDDAWDYQIKIRGAIIAARACIAKQWNKVRANTPDKGTEGGYDPNKDRNTGGNGGSVDVTKVNDLGNKFRNQQPDGKQPASQGGTGMGGAGMGGGTAIAVKPPASTTSSGTGKPSSYGIPDGSESGYELPTVSQGTLTNIWVYCDPKRIKLGQFATCKAYAGIRLGNAYPPEISAEVIWHNTGPYNSAGLQTVTANKGWIKGSDTVWVEDNGGTSTPPVLPPPVTNGQQKNYCEESCKRNSYAPPERLIKDLNACISFCEDCSSSNVKAVECAEKGYGF